VLFADLVGLFNSEHGSEPGEEKCDESIIRVFSTAALLET
jgi:hypothetical protein